MKKIEFRLCQKFYSKQPLIQTKSSIRFNFSKSANNLYSNEISECRNSDKIEQLL